MIIVSHYSQLPTDSMNWPWPNFTPKEMADRVDGALVIDPRFMDRLQALRTKLGFPFSLSSAYRTPEHDRHIGGAGVHPQGCAVDIRVAGQRAYVLLQAAMEVEFSGIGISQRGSYNGRFIHLDDLENTYDQATNTGHPRPRIWSYG